MYTAQCTLISTRVEYLSLSFYSYKLLNPYNIYCELTRWNEVFAGLPYVGMGEAKNVYCIVCTLSLVHYYMYSTLLQARYAVV